MSEKGKSFARGAALGVAAGAIAGAIAGILLAPKSGKETRKDIANYVHKMKDEIAEQLEKAGDFSKKKYNEVSEKVVGSYKKAKKITDRQAAEIKADLDKGYGKVKEAVKK
jgi:gas vesicle protein